jgi:4-amino-4-deoxy-L-arabinose transferase-like glycosyltransferase
MKTDIQPNKPGNLEIGVVPGQPKRRILTMVALGVILAGGFIVYLALLAPNRFGEYHDDSIYVTTAKALATGQGYRIISLPYEPAQTKYPPFYSFLLAMIWKLYPQFPQNLIWMMLLSVITTLSFLGLSYRYLVRQGYSTRWQALIVVALAAFNWRTLTVATGIYSEMVYAALSVAGLYLAETYEKEEKSWVNGVALGVVLGLVFLTRSSGIAVLIAVAAYYLFRRHSMRAVLPVGVGSLFVLGWLVWCYANKTNVEAVNVAYYTDYVGYFKQVVGDLASTNGTSFLMTFLSMLGRNAFMLILISIPVVCLGIPYEWIVYFGFALLFFASGFYRQFSRGIRLLYVYLICYLGLHLLWLPYVSYDRFLIPLLPFLLLILVDEFTALTSVLRHKIAPENDLANRLSSAFIGIALIVAVGVTLYSYGSDLYSSLALTSSRVANRPAQRDAEAINWINTHTNPADVLVCYYDPLYFLYTGRKTTRSMPMRAGITWEVHKMSILTIIKESKARYLVSTSSDFDNEYQPEQQRESLKVLIEQHPGNFVLVFQSTSGHSTIYRIETGESDLFSRWYKKSAIPWDHLEREDRDRFCPGV